VGASPGNPDLLERRKSIRPIPCPEATEHNDAESWSTWNALMAEHTEQHASDAAIAKVHSLLRRKP
jgi:hypothetical protein